MTLQLARRDPNGRVDGNSPASGEIGEIQTFTYTGANVTTASSGVALDVQSFTVPAGVWLLIANYTVQMNATTSLTHNNALNGSVWLTDNSNNVLSSGGFSYEPANDSTNASYYSSDVTVIYPIVINTSTTYKTRIVCSQASTIGSAFIEADGNSHIGGALRTRAVVRAIRIA